MKKILMILTEENIKLFNDDAESLAQCFSKFEEELFRVKKIKGRSAVYYDKIDKNWQYELIIE